jgi:endoglucanase
MFKNKIRLMVFCFATVFCIYNANAENLIKNAAFNNKTENWFYFTQDSAKAAIDNVDNQLQATIERAGKHPWSVGIAQAGINIEAHYVYKVSFASRSDSIKKIRVVVQMNKKPWSMYSGEHFFKLSPGLKRYEFTFTMRFPSDNDASLQFHVGGTETGELFFDDISIKKLGVEKLKIPTKFPAPLKNKISRGIAFGSTLEAPAEGAWGQVLKEEYFDMIRRKGFDHIRFPIRWETHIGNKSPYTIDPFFLKRVDWAVSHTIALGLYAVINMHHHRLFEKSPGGENKKKFLAMWRQIAEYFKDYPDNLYFEVYNEPTDKMTSVWNQDYTEVYDIIRKTNPHRTIIITLPEWGKIDALRKLKLPEKIKNDKNVYISFHFYEPADFCFQGTPNIPGIDKMHGIRWKGTQREQDKIIRKLDKIAQWASENNVKLWNGEFTAHSAASVREDVLKWIRFIARECEKRNIAWAYWDFCGDTSRIYNPDNGKFDDGIINALMR